MRYPLFILISLINIPIMGQHIIEYGDKNYMKYDSSINRYTVKSKILDGYWTVYKNQKLVEECSIVDSQKNGINIMYDFNSKKVCVENYTHDTLNGFMWNYDSNGKAYYLYNYTKDTCKEIEKFYLNGILTWQELTLKGYSIDKDFYENGRKKDEFISIDPIKYSNVLPKKYSINITKVDTAVSTEYLCESLSDDIEEEGYSNIVGYQNGNLGSYSVFNNNSYSWYEDGAKKEEVGITDSLGTFKIYYFPNGIVKRRGRYLKNIRNGVWSFYNESGKLIKSIVYKNGNEVK